MSETLWNDLNARITSCRRCPRLVAWREEVARTRRKAFQDWDYWGKPVPGFGDHAARILVVGLAPGAHGANRTGRMFTGDGSGNFLFRALHSAGFANQPLSSRRGDGLEITDMYISAVCRCAPPDNKPCPEEMGNCLPFLGEEISLLKNLQGYVALGRIAFDNVLRLYRQNGVTLPKFDFTHGGFYQPGNGLPWILASYHPSRQNTQTGRLSEAMFAEVWTKARELIDSTR